MSSSAVVFPGQGSQRRGMAIDFLDQFEEAKAIFQRASAALSVDIEAICREEDPRLDLTEFTQPCLLTAEIAMYETLRDQFGFQPGFFGGHSLGEYTALVAAGAIPFEAAVRLVHIRGKLMQSAAPVGFGGMLAITNSDHVLPRSQIQKLADEAGIDLANDNSPKQLVLSGEKLALESLTDRIRLAVTTEGLRLVPLVTSAPFHSRHMLEAESLFSKAIETFAHTFQSGKACNVTSNADGGFHSGQLADLKSALTRQISGQVRWTENMKALCGQANHIVEVGPNRPLSGFFRACGFEATAVIDVRTATRMFRNPESLVAKLMGASHATV